MGACCVQRETMAQAHGDSARGIDERTAAVSKADMTPRQLKILNDKVNESVDRQIGAAPLPYKRSRVEYPGDPNALLMTAGLEPLTKQQIAKIRPYWLEKVRYISELSPKEH